MALSMWRDRIHRLNTKGCKALSRHASVTRFQKLLEEQIDFLYKNSTSFELLRLLEKCCDEEVEHQIDAKLQKGNDNNTSFERIWSKLIGSGSSLAVNISKQY